MWADKGSWDRLLAATQRHDVTAHSLSSDCFYTLHATCTTPQASNQIHVATWVSPKVKYTDAKVIRLH
ncbi:uncharacterized protein G2W53_012727 [Senna tora]|uniref:Uncharacterized protein n=1 Tax=Senna tora TaxID=362788 RepID=A0A834TYK0_9FABA|nr:uncharacterized protein G2W53_012727 [Senna tora]